ncbi:hypothetical protein ABFB09_03280 [Dehalogenimonas sp. THU2]|uniref:hypothetical protein n=1 Tax=Dehalogenimonas sp. THU2 TaxID=3151121 RepID=UPI0032185D60
MATFSKDELEEALRAIVSTISKSEKVQLKLKAGTFQHSMTVRGIKAYYIAVELINQESGTSTTEGSVGSSYGKAELEEALQSIISAITRVEKVQPKFETGTSQHTLAIRRVKAFGIATELIKRELKHFK